MLGKRFREGSHPSFTGVPQISSMQLPLDKLSVRGGFWAWMPRARCLSSMPPTTIWRSRHLNFHTAVALHVLPLSPCAAHALGGRCLKVWGHSSAIAQACFASRWLPLLLLEPTLRRRYGQMGSQLPEITQKRVHWPGASAERHQTFVLLSQNEPFR